jgi:hypothetical protein
VATKSKVPEEEPVEAPAEAEAAPEAAAPASAGARTYTPARLIEEAEAVLGFRSYEVAGGLAGVDHEITVEEARRLVESFLSSPVGS